MTEDKNTTSSAKRFSVQEKREIVLRLLLKNPGLTGAQMMGAAHGLLKEFDLPVIIGSLIRKELLTKQGEGVLATFALTEAGASVARRLPPDKRIVFREIPPPPVPQPPPIRKKKDRSPNTFKKRQIVLKLLLDAQDGMSSEKISKSSYGRISPRSDFLLANMIADGLLKVEKRLGGGVIRNFYIITEAGRQEAMKADAPAAAKPKRRPRILRWDK